MSDQSLRQKLEAMAAAAESPNEAAIARAKLATLPAEPPRQPPRPPAPPVAPFPDDLRRAYTTTTAYGNVTFRVNVPSPFPEEK